jgi:mono/diheme cytochrome c family protein
LRRIKAQGTFAADHRHMIRSLVALALLASTMPVLAQASSAARAHAVARGKAIAEKACASCHAIGRVGRSPLGEATPFRDIGRKYPISNLEEAFGEGDTANHKGMPDFSFTPQQVADLLDYIRAVQPRRR